MYEQRDHDFRLQFRPSGGLDSAPFQKYFFEFLVLDVQTEQPLSLLRLASTCSNGKTICLANSYYGQFNDLNSLVGFQNNMSLEYKFFSEDFSDLNDSTAQRPYAVVFMNTFSKFKVDEGDSRHFIKYYSDDKIYPNFAGLDVWIYHHCNVE